MECGTQFRFRGSDWKAPASCLTLSYLSNTWFEYSSDQIFNEPFRFGAINFGPTLTGKVYLEARIVAESRNVLHRKIAFKERTRFNFKATRKLFGL
jgi:hypothetical protein